MQNAAVLCRICIAREFVMRDGWNVQSFVHVVGPAERRSKPGRPSCVLGFAEESPRIMYTSFIRYYAHERFEQLYISGLLVKKGVQKSLFCRVNTSQVTGLRVGASVKLRT